MKKVTTLLTAILFAGIGQVASAQHTGHAGHAGHEGHAGHAAHAAQPQRQEMTRDQLHAAVQEICPVSGQKLGSMGAPVKVKIGQQQMFLCCQGCMQGKVNAEHWATIHANFAKAQRICPVMKNELPEKPKWTIVEGQIVYVCCPPCTEKIEADAKTYLREVDQLYAASLKAKQTVK